MIPLQTVNPSLKSAKTTAVFAFWLLAGLLLGPATARGETMYVKKSDTKMTVEASARSRVVAVLRAGTPVNVVKKSGKFYKVSADGKSGWVFRFRLTSKSPAASGQDGDFLDALGGNQHMAARESASGSSIRGLSPVSERHARSKGISRESIEAVIQMESFKVTDAELDRFQQEGGLGEYAP